MCHLYLAEGCHLYIALTAGVRVILDFGYTKYLPVDEAREIHDYGFVTQEVHSDVIIGN
jgi:hypothetical protein